MPADNTTSLPTAGFWSSDYGWRLAGANSLWNIAKPSADHRSLVAERKKDLKDAAGEAFAKLAKELAENPEDACKFFHDKKREGKVKDALTEATKSETNITEKDGVFTVKHGEKTYTVAYVTQDSDRFAQAQLFAAAKQQKLTAPTVFVGAAVSGKVEEKDDEGEAKEVKVSYVPVFIEELKADASEKGLAEALAGMKDDKGNLDDKKIKDLADRLAKAWDAICLNIGLDNVHVIEKKEGDSTTYEIVLRADKEDVRGGSLADGKVLSMKHFISQVEKKQEQLEEKEKCEAKLKELKAKKEMYDEFAKLEDKDKTAKIEELEGKDDKTEGTIKFLDAAIKKLEGEIKALQDATDADAAKHGAQAIAQEALRKAQEAFDTADAEAVKTEKAALDDADQAVTQKQRAIDTKQAAVDAAKKAVSDAEEVLANAQKAHDEAVAHIAVLTGADNDAKKKVPNVQDDLSNVEDIKQDLEVIVANFNNDTSATGKKQLEGVVTVAKTKLVDEAGLNALKGEKPALEQAAADAKEAFEKAAKEKKEIVEKEGKALKEAQDELEKQNKIIADKQKEIDDLAKTKAPLQAKVDALKMTKDQLETESKKLQETKKQTVDGKDTDVTVGVIVDLDKQIKTIEAKNEHLKTLSEALKGRLNGLHVHQAGFVWKVIASFLWVVTLGGTLNGWLAARGINEQRDALLEAMTKQKKAKAELKKAEDGKKADAKKAYEAAKAEKRKEQAALVGRIGAQLFVEKWQKPLKESAVKAATPAA